MVVQAQPELDYFITQDGTTYLLGSSLQKNVLTDEGTGMPPIDYITQRGPFQHGETVHDYFLRPRVLQYRIHQRFCSRSDYWAGREALLDILRPNRGVSGTLRKVLSTGSVRDLTVAIQQGPGFAPRKLNEWAEWSIDEVLRFIAFNPVYYEPTVRTQTWTAPVCGSFPYTFPINLVCPFIFPITFPIMFLQFGGDPVIIDYQGSWEEYPTFTVAGPASVIRIINQTTGEDLVVTYGLLAGEVLTIDLTYSAKTITLQDGTNLLPYLSTDSDLGTFHLQPGDNLLSVNILGAGAVTQTVMTYRNRYIGI